MRWIQSAIVVYLVLALGSSPAWGVVVNFGAFDGYQDAPQNATPVGHVTFVFHHSNGETYRVDTDARGIGKANIPPGTILWCQAYAEDQLISSWFCYIPVGAKAQRDALKNAETQTENDTPIPADSQPRAVTAVADKTGDLTFFAYNPLLQIYFITAAVLVARYITLIKYNWGITHDYLMATFMATAVTTAWVLIFFGQLSSKMAGGGIADQGADQGND